MKNELYILHGAEFIYSVGMYLVRKKSFQNLGEFEIREKMLIFTLKMINVDFVWFSFRNSISDFRDLIDKGLIAVAQNDFQTAYQCFENALKLEPSNTMVR